MTKIAICDTKHFEVTYTIISLFDKADTHITVFIHAEAYEQLEFLLGESINRFTWFLHRNDEPNRDFINRMFHEISNSSYDLLYLNTVADNFILYAYHLQKRRTLKIIMTLHDINGYFQFSPSLNIRRIIRFAGKRRLIRLVPALNTLSEGLSIHLRSKLRHNKSIFTIPGSYFDPGSFTEKEYHYGESIRIAIPGSIDRRRRDYDVVFKFLTAARQINIPVSVTLLGGFNTPYGKEIQEQCLAYGSTNKDLQFFEKQTIPQPEFDEIMRQCHFVWMPLQPFVVINDGIKEEYGVSICSGNIGDAIRYAKPFFAPSGLAVDKALEESCQRYGPSSDIVSILQNLTPELYSVLQEKARIASLYYTRENIISRNASLFDSL